jgi:hypothetical protein
MTNETKNTLTTGKLELTIDARIACAVGLTGAVIYAYLKNHPLMSIFGEVKLSYTEIHYDLCFLSKKQLCDNIPMLVKEGYLSRKISNTFVSVYSIGPFKPENKNNQP